MRAQAKECTVLYNVAFPPRVRSAVAGAGAAKRRVKPQSTGSERAGAPARLKKDIELNPTNL